MKLETAIETLEYHEPSLTHDENPDIRLALRLGIEALKFVQHRRTTMAFHPDDLLPGETKE